MPRGGGHRLLRVFLRFPVSGGPARAFVMAGAGPRLRPAAGGQRRAARRPRCSDGQVSEETGRVDASLRGLVGAGRSRVSIDAAMRARDVAQPDDDDLAWAERAVVLRRAHPVPETSDTAPHQPHRAPWKGASWKKPGSRQARQGTARADGPDHTGRHPGNTPPAGRPERSDRSDHTGQPARQHRSDPARPDPTRREPGEKRPRREGRPRPRPRRPQASGEDGGGGGSSPVRS